MKTKFNGWQRLWIASSVLYLAVVIVVSINLWPSSWVIEKKYFNEVYKLIHAAEGKEENYLMSDIVSEINRRGLYENPKDLREELTLAEDWLALANLAIQKHDPEIDFTKVKRTYQIEKGKYNKEKKEQLIYALLF